MNRLAFIRRMALAAAACAFIDVPWPKERALTATEASANLEDALQRIDERYMAYVRHVYAESMRDFPSTLLTQRERP